MSSLGRATHSVATSRCAAQKIDEAEVLVGRRIVKLLTYYSMKQEACSRI